MNEKCAMYWSTTPPTAGWWVATVPTPAGFRRVKVLRDGQRDAKEETVLRAAANVLPEVTGWKLTTDGSRLWFAPVPEAVKP